MLISVSSFAPGSPVPLGAPYSAPAAAAEQASPRLLSARRITFPASSTLRTRTITDSIWQQPVLRGGDTGHRQATWIELFFDLIFVVAAAQLATFLLENIDGWGVTVYVAAYLAVWLSWVTATFYANRFDTDDLSQRLITFAQMLTVAGMAASVAEQAAIQFAISVAVFRLLMAVSYARVRIAIPDNSGFATRMIGVMSITAVIWISSVFVDGRPRIAVWALAMAIEVGAALLRSSRVQRSAVPTHVHHLVERFGLFTIIVLGETVLAVVIGVSHAHWVASAVVFAAIGLTLSFSLWWIYFETVTGSPLQSMGGTGSTVWVYAHAPLIMAITALGVGIEIAVFTEFGERLETSDALMLAGSLAIALLSLGVLLAAETSTDLRVRTFLERLPAVLLVLFIGLLPISAQAVLTTLAVIAALQATADVRASRRGVPAG
jgi:low temperature requirement protein LtrA